jgi:hypothetical protein
MVVLHLLVVEAHRAVVTPLVGTEPMGLVPLEDLAMVAMVAVVMVEVEEAMAQLTLTLVGISFSLRLTRRRSSARTPR